MADRDSKEGLMDGSDANSTENVEVRGPTRREVSRRHWEREGWAEPVDEAQEELYALFFLGTAFGEGDDGALDSPWCPRNWSRPERWVENIVRGTSRSVRRNGATQSSRRAGC